MLDMFVAFTLLAATIAVVTPLVIRHGRLLQSQRHYRLALEELTSQLDRLTMLDADELQDTVNALQPSEFVTERLPGAELDGEVSEITGGAWQVKLQLSWNAPGRREAPVTLAGWAFPQRSLAGADDGGQP